MDRIAYVGYLRVSKAKRKKVDGRWVVVEEDDQLGLLAQRKKVEEFVSARGGEVVAWYQERESATKKTIRNRPELARAIVHAQSVGATIVVAKLDRFAREESLFYQLTSGGADVLFADLPDIDTASPIGKLLLHVMVGVSAFEGRMIGERTRAALAVLKARGVPLGKPPGVKPDIEPEAVRRGARAAAEARTEKARQADRHVLPTIASLEAEGLSRRQIADRLNRMGVRRRSGAAWTHTQVARVLGRATA